MTTSKRRYTAMTEEKKPFNQIDYIAQYKKDHYDNVFVRVKKGEKTHLQAHAKAHGESLNEFIKRAISEQIKRDTEQELYGSTIHRSKYDLGQEVFYGEPDNRQKGEIITIYFDGTFNNIPKYEIGYNNNFWAEDEVSDTE
jgi:hypothetical protein